MSELYGGTGALQSDVPRWLAKIFEPAAKQIEIEVAKIHADIKVKVGMPPRAVQFSIQSRHVEYEIEVERCAPSGVFDVIASCGPEQVVSEGAQAGGDVRVLANA